MSDLHSTAQCAPAIRSAGPSPTDGTLARVNRRLKKLLACIVLGSMATAGMAQPSKTLSISAWQFLQPGRGDLLWQALSSYEQVNRDVSLKRVAYPYSSYIKTISTQLGARSGPDIFLINDVDLANFARAGTMEPIDSIVTPALKARLSPVNEMGVVDGKRYALNFDTVTFALVWNKKLLNQAGVSPPKDFANFMAAALAIKAKTGVPGFGERNQVNDEEQLWNAVSSWVIGFGGAWSKDGKLTLNAPANVTAIDNFKKLYGSGGMAVGDDFTTVRTRFAQGKIGMLIESSSGVQSILSTKDAQSA